MTVAVPKGPLRRWSAKRLLKTWNLILARERGEPDGLNLSFEEFDAKIEKIKRALPRLNDEQRAWLIAELEAIMDRPANPPSTPAAL